MPIRNLLLYSLGSGFLFACCSISAQIALPSATPSASPAQPEVHKITVQGVALSDYGANDAVTATKSDTPLLETPQTVNVIPRQLIEDQGDVTLSAALRNVGGVNVSGTYRDFDIYSIRGFFGTGFTYLDGLALDRQVTFQEELFGLDRIEVVQGPASVLYGQNPPGGLVNLISKTPQKFDFTTLSLGGDTFGSFDAGLDSNLVLNQSGSIYGRVNLLFRELGTFTEFVDPSPRVFFAPSLTIDLSRDTHITFLAQYLWETRYFGFPLPARGTVLPNVNGDISIFRNVGEPGFPTKSENWRTQFGYQLEHQFNDTFKLRQKLRFAYHESDFQGIYPTALEPDERTLDHYPYIYGIDYATLGIDTSLVAHFFTGEKVEHTALAGVDFYYLNSDSQAAFGSIDPIDLFHPNYGARPFGITQFQDQTNQVAATGLYFQEQATFYDRLSVVAGGRGDFVSNDLTDHFNGGKSDANDSAFSPRFGIVYELLPKSVSLYGSYSRSFLSQPGYTDRSGNLVPPEKGEQWEIGTKADLLDGRLTTTLAAYQIDRTNIPTPDPLQLGSYVVTGAERHRGIDWNTTLSLAPGWDLIGSYAYIDARVTEDNVIPVGSRPLDVPENTFHLFTKYVLQNGPWRGFGASIGFRYLTNQAGDAANTFRLPGYGVLDAGLYYDRGRFHAQLNLNNVTDERYAAGSYNDLYVQMGDPINLRASLRLDF